MHLSTVRLNNLPPIRAAYGEQAAYAAQQHLRAAAARHAGMAGDRLRAMLESEPFHFDGQEILLSVSLDRDGIDPAHDIPSPAFRYRRDMQLAVALLQAVRRGTTHFAWRPIASPRDPGAILYHEAQLRRVGEDGVAVDCAAGYAALAGLGLAHRLDRPLLADVIDALAADPLACLSVALSARSLKGQDAGWSDLILRLKRDRGLARRLVIEIVERDPPPAMHDCQPRLRQLQALGVRIAIGRFGTGRASVGQLMALAPDMVKLDGAFMQMAPRSPDHRAQLGHLILLARMVCPTVIVDGVESGRHLQIALDEEMEWMAGALLGRSSLRRDPGLPPPAPAIRALPGGSLRPSTLA
ncbi:EAL domain-containing protein [Sphingobium estronivorans]|uniref:EAL domain-containing protein n=1 Tax=Sphingobium estronivorans TaxID=1577690 RepID=UPI0013C2F42E|nr:EAL domain-containing protein [Sphingobium estronivorans]